MKYFSYSASLKFQVSGYHPFLVFRLNARLFLSVDLNGMIFYLNSKEPYGNFMYTVTDIITFRLDINILLRRNFQAKMHASKFFDYYYYKNKND